MEIVKTIQMKIIIFTAVKNRCILHGRVFVMLPQNNLQFSATNKGHDSPQLFLVVF